jgi:hypothetical protein
LQCVVSSVVNPDVSFNDALYPDRLGEEEDSGCPQENLDKNSSL